MSDIIKTKENLHKCKKTKNLNDRKTYTNVKQKILKKKSFRFGTPNLNDRVAKSKRSYTKF